MPRKREPYIVYGVVPIDGKVTKEADEADDWKKYWRAVTVEEMKSPERCKYFIEKFAQLATGMEFKPGQEENDIERSTP